MSVLKVGVAVVIVVYFAFAIWGLVWAVILNMRPGLFPQSQRAVQDQIFRHLHRPKAGDRLATILQQLSTELAWPLGLQEFRRLESRTSDLQFAAQSQLRSSLVSVSGILLGLCIALAGAYAWQVMPNWLLAPMLVLVLAGIVLRHLSFIVKSVTERVRRSLAIPFVAVAGTALLDALALVGAASVLTAMVSRAELTTQVFVKTAQDILNPFNLFSIFQVPLLEKFWSLIGLIFYVALAKSILDRASYERTADDRRTIASALVICGRFSEASDWMRNEQNRIPASWLIRSQIAVGSGDLETASNFAARFLSDNGEEDAEFGRQLQVIAQSVFYIELASEKRVKLLHYILEHVDDSVSCSAIPPLVVPFEDSEPIGMELLERADEDVSPLTRAVLLFNLGSQIEAIALLERTRPGLEVEEILRLVLQCHFALLCSGFSVEQKRAYVSSWLDVAAQEIVSLTVDVGKSQRHALQPWIFELDARHRGFIERFGYDETYSAEDASRFGELMAHLTQLFALNQDELGRIKRSLDSVTTF